MFIKTHPTYYYFTFKLRGEQMRWNINEVTMRRKKKKFKTIYFVPLTGHNLIALVYTANASR